MDRQAAQLDLRAAQEAEEARPPEAPPVTARSRPGAKAAEQLARFRRRDCQGGPRRLPLARRGPVAKPQEGQPRPPLVREARVGLAAKRHSPAAARWQPAA